MNKYPIVKALADVQCVGANSEREERVLCGITGSWILKTIIFKVLNLSIIVSHVYYYEEFHFPFENRLTGELGDNWSP